MNGNSKIVSTFDVIQAKSNELCLIDPMILLSIIVVICLALYLIGFRLSRQDLK